MKKMPVTMLTVLLVFVVVLYLFLSRLGKSAGSLDIIPKPVQVRFLSDQYVLPQPVEVFVHSTDGAVNRIARYLVERIGSSVQGHPFRITKGTVDTGRSGIHLLLNAEPWPTIGDEGYRIVIDRSVLITANRPRGLFYGVQTLLQLMPTEMMAGQAVKNSLVFPRVEITDYPRFTYRGMHLDVGRHFFGVESIKRYIDLIAFHKMNTFHWHLTEDQGWRIEIRKYPKLTEVGSTRKETVVERNLNPYVGDGQPVSGFYTQAQIKEIVQYAGERFVTIIPEIELPGHSQAALAAYPQLGCTGGPYEVATMWGVKQDVYCAGNEAVYRFLEDVLTEVMELFPSKYIHIGGDECPKDRWKECPKCQSRIKAEGLENEDQLQNYFITRIEKFLNERGRNIIGWDEILEGGLAPNATVMSWRGMTGGMEAARQKHEVVMTPGTHCYFDHYQGDPQYEPLAWGGFTTLKKVYSFEPVPSELNEEEAKYVIGAQGNVWTEYIKTYHQVEYMATPRMAALAEVVWSPKGSRNWKDFKNRMKQQFLRYKTMNVNFCPPSCMVTFHPVYNKASGNLMVKLETEDGDIPIHFTLDGSKPAISSPVYSQPIFIKEDALIKAEALVDGRLRGRINQQRFSLHKAVGARVFYTNQYQPKYPASGELGLVDGIHSPVSVNHRFWQGFEGVDFEAVLELNKATEVSRISVGSLHAPQSWIFRPDHIDFYISTDGREYVRVARQLAKTDLQSNEVAKEVFVAEFKAVKVKVIKIFAQGVKSNPDWHSSPGGKSWIFLDEIIVQ